MPDFHILAHYFVRINYTSKMAAWFRAHSVTSLHLMNTVRCLTHIRKTTTTSTSLSVQLK